MNDTRDQQIKNDLQQFYKSEASRRDSEEWVRSGDSARVPESKSAHYFVDRKVDQAVQMAAASSDASVLEVGCSFGQMTFLLTRRFRQVTAVDLSPESIDLVRRRAEYHHVENLRLQQADAEDLSVLQSNQFDAAFSFSVLRYVPHPEKGVKEIHRVLKPGARAVIDFPNKYSPWFGPMKKILGIKSHIHDKLFSAGEVVDMMKQAGFTDIQATHLLFTTRRLPVRLLPLFKVVDRVLEAIPGVRNLAAIIMVSGRK